MSELKWTSEKPKEAGWYWYRYGNYGRRIYCITHPTEQGLIVHILEDWKLLSEMNDGQWAGPIPEPTESTPPHYIDPATLTDLNQRLK